jgi:hypothetical protein
VLLHAVRIERRHVYLSFRSREPELGLAGVAFAELYSRIQYEGECGVEEDSPSCPENVPRGSQEDSLE